MSRKDTIIIATLVNGVLLIALFLTALRRDDSSKRVAEVKPIALPKESREIKVAQGDEIDQVLKQFSEKKQPGAVAKAEEPKIDFAKELEAITRAAVVKKKAPKKSSGDFIEVKVKKGDALAKIARVHNTSVEQLVAANNLKSTVLQIGQVIKVPNATAPKADAVSDDASEEYYTVRTGDNPWTIAVKNRIKVDELLKLNNLNEDKARRLKPGDKLRIR